ncbi:MAG: GNAT family N-acetyltransferase [Sulfurimonas sp.]|jgi:UDP-N-acetylmuramyl pentapeptide synthase/ribosomal protein S18 acetylase RimI-like enzyme
MNAQIYLSAQELASITGGVWKNLDEFLIIHEIHETYHYLQPNDMFVVHYDDWYNKTKSNEHKIEGAIKKGISALMLKQNSKVKTSLPTLRVKNTYEALRKIALYTSELSQAKRVLITGSYGKTGFKVQLYNIIKEQINTYTRLNSSNMIVATYCNLASLKKDTELFLIEQPVSTLKKTYRRASYVKPDISVITSIGHEGIERFKTIENIIENKLQVAHALREGGKLLLPQDDKYYEKILKEAQKYKHIEILTYGTNRLCNANVLYKKFSDFGWDVIAKIEDIVVAYHVPFFEEYAVSVSCGVLLCAYHLGLDVHRAADIYYKNTNFKSSGLFYEVSYKEKKFYLYDQSNRGGIEGYESFFKTLSYIKPQNEGKKILLTSEFVDYEDGEMNFINTKKFQKIIQESGIETLFSVEKFTEHINVLGDKSIWKNHSIDWNNIKDEILATIQKDDIFCVKGIFDSTLTEFMNDFRNLDGLSIQEFKSQNTMAQKNEAFKNLKTLHPTDIGIFQEAVEKEQKKGFIYYFPFLYFWSLSNNRELLIDKTNDSISLFLLDKLGRSYPPKLQLYIPTLPTSSKEQTTAFERIYRYKGYKSATIVRLDREDVIKLKAYDSNLTFNYKIDEYLFEPKRYEDLSGGPFRNLRHQVSLFLKNENIEVVPYEKKYEQACLNLLITWAKNQVHKYENLEDTTYTKNSILHYNKFNEEALNGLVILQNNKVMSFTFFGKIHTRLFCMFIGKSDHSLKGVQSYIKYQLLLKNKQYALANDGDGIANGLDTSKRMLRPVAFNKVYAAYNKEKITLLDKRYINQILEIQTQVFSTTHEKDLISKNYFLKCLNSERVYGYLSSSKNLKAFVVLRYENENLRIYDLASKQRDRGFGTKMLKFVLEMAKEENYKTLSLEVNINNPHAIHLYEKFGFQTKEILENYYHSGESAYQMQLKLGV